jgi:excisionase family DNA binding protein
MTTDESIVEWYTPITLARHWHVHEETIRRLIRNGELSAHRVGRMLRISRTDAAIFFATRCAVVALKKSTRLEATGGDTTD